MSLAHRASISLTAAAAPAMVLGPAAVAIALVGALLLYAVMLERGSSLRRLRDAMTTPLSAMVLLTFVAWLPNTMTSPEPLRSLEAVTRTLVYVGGAAVLWSALRGDATDRATRMSAMFTLLATAIALVSLLVAPELISLLRAGEWQHVSSEIWIKSFASSAALLMPVILLAGKRSGSAWMTTCVLTCVGLIAVIWLTNSRSAMAGLLAIILLWIGLSSMPSRRPRWIAAMLVVMVATTAGVLGWLYETRDGRAVYEVELFAPKWLIDSHRQEIWRYAWQLGEGHRWVGVGANAVDRLASGSIPGTTADRLPSHPHNWPIEIAVETGIVGLTALLALLAVFYSRLLRDFRAHGDDAVLAAILVGGGFWVSGLFNFSFWSSWWQCSYFALTAICLSARRDLPRT